MRPACTSRCAAGSQAVRRHSADLAALLAEIQALDGTGPGPRRCRTWPRTAKSCAPGPHRIGDSFHRNLRPRRTGIRRPGRPLPAAAAVRHVPRRRVHALRRLHRSLPGPGPGRGPRRRCCTPAGDGRCVAGQRHAPGPRVSVCLDLAGRCTGCASGLRWTARCVRRCGVVFLRQGRVPQIGFRPVFWQQPSTDESAPRQPPLHRSHRPPA